MMGQRRYLKAKTHFFNNVKLDSVLDANVNSTFTGTKLVATLGPSCHEVDVLAEMLDNGLAAGRVDLTWGPLEFHRKSLNNLQLAMRKARKLCATMLDTMGRELMIKAQWQVNEQGYPWCLGRREITTGQTVIITTRSDAPVDRNDNVLPIMYDQYCDMVMKGDTVYVGRYLVSGQDVASLFLEVVDVKEQEVVCVAKNDAVLEGLLCVFHVAHGGKESRMQQCELPLLSDWDKEIIRILGQEFDVDFISLSYTRDSKDVEECRSYLDSLGMYRTKILAKIETKQALMNLQDILNEADGIIISRGNLGLDCEPEKMALIQKTVIQACNLAGKPVIITRCVDTMVSTPRPTRAEATDVANAVLDGVDGILLGAETLRGKYPVETCRTVCSICRAAEAVYDHSHHYEHLMEAAFEAAQLGGVPLDDMDEPPASYGPAGRAPRTSMDASVKAMTKYIGSTPNLMSLSLAGLTAPSDPSLYHRTPYLGKMESIASSAVRAADKVKAKLIVVYTHTGKTAELVAKYRPPVPILTLVVPHLTSDSLKWRLEGRHAARQALVVRGLMPTLAAPSPSGDVLLEEAVAMACRMGLVGANDVIIVVQRLQEDFCIKIVSTDSYGHSIRRDEEGSVHLRSVSSHLPLQTAASKQ